MVKIDKIVRQKRKTLTIKIFQSGEVVVLAPLNLDEKRIEQFVLEKSNWIEKKLKRIGSLSEQFSSVLEYKSIMFLGKKYSIFRSNQYKKISLVEDKFCIPSSICNEKLIPKTKNWLVKQAENILLSRLDDISHQIGLSPLTTKCSGSRGRWGACSSKKQISLNFRAVMLPLELVDYIIIHELVHLVEMNHSPKFWKIVENFMPDYKRRNKALKDYGVLLKLF